MIYRDLIGIQLKEQYKLGILGFPSECQISNWRALGGTFQTEVRVSCSGGTIGGWKGHIPHTPVLFKMDRFSNSCKYYHDNNVCVGGGSKQDLANNTHAVELGKLVEILKLVNPHPHWQCAPFYYFTLSITPDDFTHQGAGANGLVLLCY